MAILIQLGGSGCPMPRKQRVGIAPSWLICLTGFGWNLRCYFASHRDLQVFQLVQVWRLLASSQQHLFVSPQLDGSLVPLADRFRRTFGTNAPGQLLQHRIDGLLDFREWLIVGLALAVQLLQQYAEQNRDVPLVVSAQVSRGDELFPLQHGTRLLEEPPGQSPRLERLFPSRGVVKQLIERIGPQRVSHKLPQPVVVKDRLPSSSTTWIR